MDFTALALEHISVLRPYFKDNISRICDCTVGGTFIWRDYLTTEFSILDGVLFLKANYPGVGTAFSPPQCAVTGRAEYAKIIEYCAGIGLPARVCAVSEELTARLLRIFPNAKARTDRAWSDYLYESDDIVNLAGRKFSGQRNHINRFMREYPAWEFRPITRENLGEVRGFFERYSIERVKDYPAYNEGNRKTLEVLDNLELYGMFGGALYVNGAVIGASLGEIVGDTLFVHIEKAQTDVAGAYPMVTNQFARMFATGGTRFINREEDDGVEGLRVSKLSYHPVRLLDKYTIEL